MDLRSTIDRLVAYFLNLLVTEPIVVDPIDHPDIMAMNLRQLADLPFDPYSRKQSENKDEIQNG